MLRCYPLTIAYIALVVTLTAALQLVQTIQ